MAWAGRKPFSRWIPDLVGQTEQPVCATVRVTRLAVCCFSGRACDHAKAIKRKLLCERQEECVGHVWACVCVRVCVRVSE